MSALHPFGHDLPPGVTNADIELSAGPELFCDRCTASVSPTAIVVCDQCVCAVCPDCYDNEQKTCKDCASLSPCCGVAFDKDTRLCPKCGEHC